MTNSTAIIRNAGEGEKRWFCGGGLHTWMATSDDTNGAFLLFEDEMEAGKVTPLHAHPGEDETFYVIEGEIVVHVAEERRVVGAGGIAVIPRGVPHAFMATSNVRMLCLQTPGSGGDFYLLASDPALPGEPPTTVDFDRVREAATRTGTMVLLGPPPF